MDRKIQTFPGFLGHSMKGCSVVEKAVIYARQSSGDEEQSASVEQQIINCKRFAEEKNFTVTGIFTDLNVSGKTYPDTTEAIALAAVDAAYKNWVDSTYLKATRYRKGLASVLSALKGIDYVLLDDFTRLMRPISGSYLESHIIQKFRSADVKIWSVKGGVSDFGNFADNLVATLISQINANQLEIQRQKSIAGLRALRDSGFRTNGANFYGYRYVKNQTYEIVLEEAAAVKKAFELGINQVPYIQICRTLAGMLGKNSFSRNTLNDIFRRPEYAGYQYNSQGELVESKCFKEIPIITLTQFRKIGERIKNRKVHNHDRKEVYAFTGLCFCGYCGERMQIKYSPLFVHSLENEKPRFFSCFNHFLRPEYDANCSLSSTRYQYYNNPFNCNFKKQKFPVKQENLEQPLIPSEFQNLGLFESLMPFVAIPLLEDMKRLRISQKVQENIQKLESRKSECLEFEKKLSDMLFQKVIDDDQFISMVSKSKKEREEISQKIIDLMEQVTENREEELENIKKILYLLQLKKIDKYLYKKYAQSAIKKIVLFMEKIEVEISTGEKVVLERIPSRCSRVLPNWSLEWKNGRACVTYYYKSFYRGDRQEKILLDGKAIFIKVVGINPPCNRILPVVTRHH